MAGSIALKTFRGGNVTPQDDAIIYQTVLPGAGIFKGCEVSFARSNVLHISQGFGMIKGRFFEMYETEVPVQLADTGQTKLGRLYLHMDLSNTDEPIQIIAETATELSTLASDVNVNYNNTTYDLELAKFKVTAIQISDLTNTFKAITAGGGGGGGGSVGLERETKYSVGDTVSCSSAPGWCTLYCTQAGGTDALEPKGYSQITKVGDKVLDGTCVFEARNIVLELTQAQTDIVELGKKHDEDVAALDKKISDTADEVAKQMSTAGNLVQKIMSITDYQKLSTYDKNTMYYCYDNADTQEIKFIYLGQHVIYATGISVTYQVDTNNAITQVGVLSNDAIASAPAVSKAGFTFVGWKSDTNADSGVLDKYIINSDSAVTLYAVFKKQITISTDAGDAELIEGKKESSQKVDLYYNNGVTLSDEVTMPENVYELSEQKAFCGWKTNLSSADIYVPGEKYKFTKDEELVPAFIDIEYDFLSTTGGYQMFHVPADGIYEFELWGAAGADASGSVTINGANQTLTAKGGKGGHVKAYKKCKKDTYLYVYNGGKPTYQTNGGNNGGAPGYSYSSGTYKNYGAGGGGATHVATSTLSLSYNSSSNSNTYNQRDKILLIAGGGGGGGITGYTSDGTYSNQPYKALTANVGGYGGGERGEDGSGGNLGGRQTAVGAYDYTNFGGANYPGNSTSYTYSGGGGGWFGGNYGVYGNSGAGGSSYVGNMPTFTHNGKRYKTLNEPNVNDGNGYAYIRYMEPCKVD